MDALNPLRVPVMFQTPRRLTNNPAWQMHLPFAFLLVSLHRPRVLVELGVHKGDSYCGWCQAVDVLGLDAACYGIDTWQGDAQAGYYDDALLRDLRGHHDPLYGRFSELLRSTFDDALPQFADCSVDLLHIDGFHTYEAVAHDFASWRPKLSDRAIVVFHDTNERSGDFGVWRLWEELALTHPAREFKFGHGLGVLAVGSPLPTEAQAIFDMDERDWDGLSRLACSLGERVRFLAERRVSDDEGLPSYEDLQKALEVERARVGEATEVLLGVARREDARRAEHERAMAQMNTQLAWRDFELGEIRTAMRQVTESTSWRITAPLRSAMGVARKGLAGRSNGGEPPAVGYDEWVGRFASLDGVQLGRLRTQAEVLDGLTISVVMPVFNPQPAHLRRAIESVRAQIYPRWQLCIADDASTDPEIGTILAEFERADERIVVTRRPANGHISAASNSALELATGAFVALLDHDDELAPEALYLIATEIAGSPDLDIVYSDEDKIDGNGRRYDPHFKPDLSPALLLGQNYISHLGVYRRSLVTDVGGFREGFEGAQDYDLLLRCLERIPADHVRHVPRVLYHWRAAAGSTALAGGEKDYAADAGRRAVRSHLDQLRLRGAVGPAGDAAFNRVSFELRDPAPLVSIVIPTRNAVDLLRRCVASIRERTTYSPYEIVVVDNATDDRAALTYLAELAEDDDCTVVRYDDEFNFSAINNFGANAARGELLVLLNNDTEVISPSWLEELAMWATQPDVGTVGCKLLYPDGTLQHGGIVIGIGGIAGHSHKGIPGDAGGYFSRLRLAHEVGGNTAACVMIRAALFREMGGLNASHLAVAFNDVDLCLRMTERGLRNIWTPHAVLTHYESKTRGYEDTPSKQARFLREREYMLWRWADLLRSDPYYSPNLTREREDYSLAVPPRVSELARSPDT